MRLRVSLSCLAALSISTAASAQTFDLEPAKTPAKQVEQVKVEEKKICKSYGTTGSRLPAKRVCLTQERWDARARDDREMLEGWRQNSATINCHPTVINGVATCAGG